MVPNAKVDSAAMSSSVRRRDSVVFRSASRRTVAAFELCRYVIAWQAEGPKADPEEPTSPLRSLCTCALLAALSMTTR
jgi:hypothetical protein